jgi:hypothetical protein
MKSKLSESPISNKIEQIVGAYPEIKGLQKILDSELNITEDFLTLYFKINHPKKNLILRQLVGEPRQFKESPEYYAIRGLQYILHNPVAPIDEMRHGNIVPRDMIPKSLSTQLNIPRNSYYPFIFDYAVKTSTSFPDSSRIQTLSKKIIQYFVLDDRTASAFAGGYTTNKRIGHYFPDSNKAISTLNALTFMKALIPEIKENLKAQDKLPAPVYKLMGLKCRSIPQALAFTDILIMHALGIASHKSNIGLLSMDLLNSEGLPFSIRLQAEALLSDLSQYFFLKLDQEFYKLGGNLGSSFQFNLARLVDKEWQINRDFIKEYQFIERTQMISYISDQFCGDRIKLLNLLEVIGSNALSGIDTRDFVNIFIHSENLRLTGELDFIRNSPTHYSKILPAVAQFKLGRKEPKKLDLSKTSTTRVNGKDRGGVKIDMLENCITALSSNHAVSEKDNNFKEFWTKFSTNRKIELKEEAFAYEIWKTLKIIEH